MRIINVFLLFLTLALCSQSVRASLIVGFGNTYFQTEMEAILADAGISSAGIVDLEAAITADSLFLQRNTAVTATAKANVLDFLASGGTVVTEFSATDYWFDGTLANLAGTQVDDFRLLLQDNVVVDSLSPLAAGLPATWGSDDPTEFTNVYSGLDAAFNVVIEKQGTPFGTVVTAATTNFGLGTAVAMFTDFADFSAFSGDDSKRLLVNAVSFSQAPDAAVPAPATLALLGLGLLGLRLRRK